MPDQWKCSWCRGHNDAGRERCEFCGITPDRPGDRDQQQAAELPTPEDEATGRRFARIREQGRALAIAMLIAETRASARAEEAARWQAELGTLRAYVADHGPDFADWLIERDARTRAVLDGER